MFGEKTCELFAERVRLVGAGERGGDGGGVLLRVQCQQCARGGGAHGGGVRTPGESRDELRSERAEL